MTALSSWLFKGKSSSKLKKKAQNIRIAYLTFDIPWPAKDRDLVLLVQTEYAEGPKSGTIFPESVSDYYPVKKQFALMSRVKGKFTFSTLQMAKWLWCMSFYGPRKKAAGLQSQFS
jgi:hypothetical protein